MFFRCEGKSATVETGFRPVCVLEEGDFFLFYFICPKLSRKKMHFYNVRIAFHVLSLWIRFVLHNC